MADTKTIHDIMRILPHRFPFLLIDRVLEISDDLETCRVLKNVTANEPQFTGHFPEYPVMPGVLIIEALAQVGAVAILSLPENQGKIALFGGVKNARFRRKVTPGDVLEMECVLTKRRGPVGIGECKATVNGELACTAELTFAIGAE